MAESEGERMWFFTGIYLLLTLGAFFTLVTAIAAIFFVITPHVGKMLHARLLRTVMYAPHSYFANTETGTTLNRFSSDMMMLDRQLPFALFQVFQSVFRLLSQGVLLCVVQPLITATLPFTFLVVYVIQKVYLATSRQLRFLDLEARALVNASFLETLEGVATIRAFGWQPQFIRDNVKKLDLSLRPAYMLTCIQRWLDLVLDLMVPGLAIGTIGLAIALKGTTTGGQIGIALNVVLQVNGLLLRLVQSWTRLETSLGALSRLRAFERDVLPEDKEGESQTPPPAWPTQGALEFDNMSASYNPPNLALDHINISIHPGTKVGVVGRTGSGKSTLLLTLLRLVEMEGQGTLRIDGLDLRVLSRNAIRSRIVTVPQDPMLVMTETVRENLDITGAGHVSDENMSRVLERVHLWEVLVGRIATAKAARDAAAEVDAAMGLKVAPAEVQAGSSGGEGNGTISPDESTPLFNTKKEGNDGGEGDYKEDDEDEEVVAAETPLDLPMRSLPLSQGQQQLFSLARAILMRPSRGKVVLLDEATSNVDGETDKLMQRLVREEFRDHTVITVAHRLDTIMDSDLVMVLEAGRLIEAGTPEDLRGNQGGAFRALIHGKR